MFDEDPQNLVGDLHRLVRRNDHARVAREILVTRDPAERETEINARRDAMLVVHDNGLKADVIGVFQRADQSRAVKGDVELARQSVTASDR